MCNCRLCLGAWSDHGERTGGFYACNRYEAAKQEGAVWALISCHLYKILLIAAAISINSGEVYPLYD